MTTPEWSDADIEELARFAFVVQYPGAAYDEAEPWQVTVYSAEVRAALNGSGGDADDPAWHIRAAASLLRRERERVARDTLTITRDEARTLYDGEPVEPALYDKLFMFLKDPQ